MIHIAFFDNFQGENEFAIAIECDNEYEAFVKLGAYLYNNSDFNVLDSAFSLMDNFTRCKTIAFKFLVTHIETKENLQVQLWKHHIRDFDLFVSNNPDLILVEVI